LQGILLSYLEDIDMLTALFLPLHLCSKQICLKRQAYAHIRRSVFSAPVLSSMEEKAMESWLLAGSDAQDYEVGIDPTTPYQGKNSGYIQSAVEAPAGFGTLMQMFKAAAYRNKRMRFSAAVKSKGVEIWAGGAGLWMRIDGPEDGKALGFDNMMNRRIQGTTDWQRYEVVLDIPQESVYVAFGIMLCGRGQAWLSDVRFEEVGTDVLVTSPRGEYPTDVRVTSFRDVPDQPGNLDFVQ